MPQCKKCLLSFSQSIIIDNTQRIIRNRIHCFDCVPFNSQRTNTKSITDEEKGQDKICQCCGKAYNKWAGGNHGNTYCNACKTSRRRIYLKIKAVEYLGGKCERCEYNECIEALVFHHRDPSTKSFNISSNYNKAWTKIEKELDKCDLLCSNCHLFIHYANLATKFTPAYDGLTEKRKREKSKLVKEHREKSNIVEHNTFCANCNKGFTYRNKNQKYCSLKCFNLVRRKVERPTKEQLKELLKTKSMVSIGKDYGVSDNAIRKWCKTYGLEWKNR